MTYRELQNKYILKWAKLVDYSFSKLKKEDSNNFIILKEKDIKNLIIVKEENYEKFVVVKGKEDENLIIIKEEEAKNFAIEYIKDLFDISDDNKHFIDCKDIELVAWEEQTNNSRNYYISLLEVYFTLDNKINGKIIFSGIDNNYQLDNTPLIRFTNNILDKEVNFNNTLNILLLQASENNNLERLKLLVDEGVYIDIRDEYGKTALMLASEYGHSEVVKYLIDKGTDINAKNNDGKTALMLASENGHSEVAELLKANGAV